MLDVKKLLTKILDVFNTTSTTLTGSYNLKAVAYRRCGIVTINIWQTALANIPKGTWITVGTLPEEYRPSHQLDTLGVDNNTSSVQNNSLQLRIPTSGEVKVWAYSNGVTTNQLLSTVTFIGGGYLTSKLYEIFSHLERWWEYVRLKGVVGENIKESSASGYILKISNATCKRTKCDIHRHKHTKWSNNQSREFGNNAECELGVQRNRWIQQYVGASSLQQYGKLGNKRVIRSSGILHDITISERGCLAC